MSEFFSSVSNECAVYSVTIHSVKKKMKTQACCFCLMPLFIPDKTLPVQSIFLRLPFVCTGALAACQQPAKRGMRLGLLYIGSMISVHSYSPDPQNKAAQRIFCEGSHPQCKGLHFCSFRKDLLAASWACPSS